jgi:hypothetical protein
MEARGGLIGDTFVDRDTPIDTPHPSLNSS